LMGTVLCHCTFATVRDTTTAASLFKAVRIIRRIIPTLLPLIRLIGGALAYGQTVYDRRYSRLHNSKTLRQRLLLCNA
jgi:hypothetical protein